MIGVDRDDVGPLVGSDPRKHAEVRAQVPHEPSRSGRDRTADELRFQTQVPGVVAMRARVLGPCRPRTTPREPPGDLPQALRVRANKGDAESRAPQVAAQIASRVGVRRLRAGLQVYVQEDARPQVVPSRHDLVKRIRGDTSRLRAATLKRKTLYACSNSGRAASDRTAGSRPKAGLGEAARTMRRR